MTIDNVRTRHYRLTCRRCHRTWTATYQVGTFTDDAGDHEVYFRGGAPATAPGVLELPALRRPARGRPAQPPRVAGGLSASTTRANPSGWGQRLPSPGWPWSGSPSPPT